jgi:hypothetical protein
VRPRAELEDRRADGGRSGDDRRDDPGARSPRRPAVEQRARRAGRGDPIAGERLDQAIERGQLAVSSVDVHIPRRRCPRPGKSLATVVALWNRPFARADSQRFGCGAGVVTGA